MFRYTCINSKEVSGHVETNPDLLYWVTPDSVSQIFFSVLKPAVKCWCLLSESQVQIFNLSVFVLKAQQTLFPTLGVVQKFLPALHDIIVTFLDSRGLGMLSLDQLIFQGRDGLNSFFLKSLETSIESFLQILTININKIAIKFPTKLFKFYLQYKSSALSTKSYIHCKIIYLLSKQGLNGRKISPIIVRADLSLFVGDPALHYIGLPQELEKGGVIHQTVLSSLGRLIQSLQFLLETLDSLLNVVFVMISLKEHRGITVTMYYSNEIHV